MASPFDLKRKKNGWITSHLAHWTERNTAYISCVFSWDIQNAYQLCVSYRTQGYHVRAGGPAIALNPDPFKEIAELGGTVHALPHHNPNATFTSRGCIRKCRFCAVPRLEGDLVELDDWEVKPIVCDNNLLACSQNHFDKVIDRLKTVRGVDFNQGLDARLLTKYHAGRIAELNLRMVRLAWDDTRLESQFMAAYEKLRKARIPKRKISVYVLIGFNDTPEDALYRLKTINSLGSYPQPMRYQPIDALKKNSYIHPAWSNWLLGRYMKYWSNNRLNNIPFEQWVKGQPVNRIDKKQLKLAITI